MGETSATLVMLQKLPKKNIRSQGACHVGHVFCERGGEREPQNQPVEGNHFPIKIQNKYDDSGNLYTIIRALHVHALVSKRHLFITTQTSLKCSRATLKGSTPRFL